MPEIILRQAQDEVQPRQDLALTLSLSKGEGGQRHFLNAVPAQDEVQPRQDLALTLSLSKGEGGQRHFLNAVPEKMQP